MNISKRLLTCAVLMGLAGSLSAQNLSNWSQTASANNAAAPNGWPTGMSPADVKLTGRQMMSAVRAFYDDAQWINPGYGLSLVSSTAFAVGDSNSGIYHANRRVRVASSSGGTIYGTIASTSYSAPSTTVTITPDSGSIAGTVTAVYYGAVSAQNSSVVSATLGLSSLYVTTDKLISGTTTVQAISGTSMVSVTTGGVNSAWFNTSGLTVSGTISTTGVISASGINSTGDISATGRTLAISSINAAATVSAVTISATNVNATNIASAVTAKAWANIVGSSGSINSSYNISGVTRTGAGRYNISFTTPMPNANYSVVGSPQAAGGLPCFYLPNGGTKNTGGVQVSTDSCAGGALDATSISLAVFSQ